MSFVDTSENVRYPILGTLYHPLGRIIRHDAVLWWYACRADAFPYMGVGTGHIAHAGACFLRGIGFTVELDAYDAAAREVVSAVDVPVAVLPVPYRTHPEKPSFHSLCDLHYDGYLP